MFVLCEATVKDIIPLYILLLLVLAQLVCNFVYIDGSRLTHETRLPQLA